MKIIPSVFVIIGVVFVLIGMTAPGLAPLQVIGYGGGSGGGTTSSYDYTWTISGSISQNPTAMPYGQSVTLIVDVTSYSSSGGGGAGGIQWVVDGTVVHAVSISGIGVWSYTYIPVVGSHSWDVRYLSSASSTGGMHFGSFGSGSFTVTQAVTPPTIDSISSSLNPSTVGTSISFDASISWNGNVGGVIWYVDGSLISGNSYVFNTAATYTIEAYAQNSAGSTSKIMSQVVNPLGGGTTNGTTNGTNTNLNNVGSFYYSVNESNAAKMTNSLNYTFTSLNATTKVAFYYVMTNGQTQNARAYYVSLYDMNTGATIQLTIPTSNVTTLFGDTTYYAITTLGVGQYKVTGFVLPSNGNPAVDIVSSQINIQITSNTVSHTVNYIDVSIGGILLVVGLITWRRLP